MRWRDEDAVGGESKTLRARHGGDLGRRALGPHGQTFLQKVDTVKLVDGEGTPISAPELRVGMRVLGWCEVRVWGGCHLCVCV